MLSIFVSLFLTNYELHPAFYSALLNQRIHRHMKTKAEMTIVLVAPGKVNAHPSFFVAGQNCASRFSKRFFLYFESQILKGINNSIFPQ